MEGKRILAVEIDSELFDKLDDLVTEEQVSKKKFVSSIIEKAIEERLEKKQAKEIVVKQMDGQKTWDRTEVMNAIDKFMIENDRIPSQKEFKNENGLPSYGAAARALQVSPAEYMKDRYAELQDELCEEQTDGMSINM